MSDSGSKTAFVTGASGFTGGRLTRHLIDAGYDVTALVRPGSKVDDLQDLGVDLVVGDLREPSSFSSAIPDQSIVFHIAAAFRAAKLSDKEYFDVNVEGTRNVLEAAGRAGVRRFVHCSTIGVHGDTGKEPATEETPFAPPDTYCESKLAGELLARKLFDELGLDGVVFRPLGIYGPEDTRFLKLFKSVKKGRFIMIGDGRTLYHMTFIDDLCQGIILCGTHPAAIGEVFILGGDKHTDLNNLVGAVAEAVNGSVPTWRIPTGPVMMAARLCETVCRPIGIEPPLYPRRVEFFTKDRAADISKARTLLGYSPEVSLQDGLRQTASWYEKHSLL